MNTLGGFLYLPVHGGYSIKLKNPLPRIEIRNSGFLLTLILNGALYHYKSVIGLYLGTKLFMINHAII